MIRFFHKEIKIQQKDLGYHIALVERQTMFTYGRRFLTIFDDK